MATVPRTRIAPSPTGDPHVGTAYVALFNRSFAHRNGGSFILRIDDTDRTRYHAGAEEAIFRSLRWLGLEWDEGPDIGGPHAPYRQSECTHLYRQASESLVAKGAAYRCFCTPERLAQLREQQREDRGQTGYDRRCRDLPASEVAARLAQGAPHTVRLKIPTSGETTFRDELRGPISIENSHIDDQVLMKSDGFPTYHLANVVDDARMGITHVVRAEEWLVSAPKHILIHQALGEPAPQYFHVPLLRNADKSKISKRKNPVSLLWFREQGYIPEGILNFLALLGCSPPDGQEVFDTASFQQRFDLRDITLGSPVFDMTKLEWLNGVHLRQLAADDLARRLEAEGFLPGGATAESLACVFPLVAERLHRLSEFSELTSWYFQEVEPEVSGLVPGKLAAADGQRWLTAICERLGTVKEWTEDAIEAAVEEERLQQGLKKPQAFMPLRMAITGKQNSPPLPAVLRVLGLTRVQQRLQQAVTQLATAART